MKAFALFLGFALAALCAVALVTPELLLGVARHFATPAGLYVAAALRIGLGILFLGIAGRSRSPTGLRILGAITLIGGVLTPFVGVDRAQAYLDWWSHRGDLVLRLWAAVGLALGLFIAWAATPRHRALRAVHR